MRSRTCLALAALATALGAACSDDGRPSSLHMGRGGGSGDTGGTGAAPGGGAAGAGATGAGAAGAEAGAGAGGDAGSDGVPDAGSDAAPDAADPDAAVTNPDAGVTDAPNCPALLAFGPIESLSELDTSAEEVPLALTPDELVLVFERVDGAASRLLLAERASRTTPFDAPVELVLPSGYAAGEGVALTPDGLRLVLISDDGKRFGQLTRAGHGAAFSSEIDEAPFAPLNTLAIHTGDAYTAPVLSAGGELLVFSAYAASDSLVYVATQSELQLWQSPAPQDAFWFAGGGAALKLPTGISSDLRTLFYYDEGTSQQAAVWRRSPGDPFDQKQVFAGYRGAIPNASCDAIYTSLAGELILARPSADGGAGGGGTGGTAGASGDSGAAGAAGADRPGRRRQRGGANVD
jgi:hypothetical protein